MGCDGAAGPDGEDAPRVDNIGPSIQLIQPQPGADITTSTMTLEAALDDTEDVDNGDIDRIRFYVDGSNMLGEDSAVVTEEPYVFEWDFDVSGTGYGPVTIMAEAVDTLGNINSTALLLVNRRQLADRDTLSDRFVQGFASSLSIPFHITLFDTNNVPYDTIRVTELGTRFLAQERCVLSQARIYPVIRAAVPFDNMADYWVIVRASQDSLYPGEALDSVLVQPDLMLYDRWLTLDLDSMPESVRTFEAGETFFLTLRPDADPDSLDSGLTIGTLFESDSTGNAEEEKAYWLERTLEGNHWRPVVESYQEYGVHHLYLEAVVDYQPEGD